MRTKRNRKPRNDRNQRATPRNISSANLRGPRRPPRPVAPRPRPRVSAQYVGKGQRPERCGRVAPVVQLTAGRGSERVAEPVATAPSPAPTVSVEVPRRLSVSTAVLLLVVGLEVAAAAVLAVRLGSAHDEGATVSGRSSYGAPVRVPVGTAYVSTRVVAPESLRVTHWLHTGSDITRVRIHVPQVPGLVGEVTVSNLVIAAEGQPVTAPALPSQALGQTYVVPAGRHIYVSYVLQGALQRDSAPAGRALARFTALDVATPQAPVTRSRRSVAGARVLALACSPSRPGALPYPCGSPAGSTWGVVLAKGHTGDRVMAQLDLS